MNIWGHVLLTTFLGNNETFKNENVSSATKTNKSEHQHVLHGQDETSCSILCVWERSMSSMMDLENVEFACILNSFITTRNEKLTLLLGKDRSISKSLPIWEPSLIKCTRTGCTSHPTAEYIMTARPWSSSSLISMHVNSNFPAGRVFIWWTISTEPQKTNHSQHPWSTRHFALLCTFIIMFQAYFILWVDYHSNLPTNFHHILHVR